MMKFLCVVLLFLLCAVCNTSASRTVVAHGTKPHTYQLLGKASPSSFIQFKVLLKQNNVDVIDKTFWEVSDPKHPRFGKFLSQEEVSSLVASDVESVQAVKKWLSQEGVTSSQMTVFSDYISVKVPVSHAEKIFSSSFFDFQSKKGKKLTRIIGEASIPEEIVPHIDFISGLSEFLADAHHTPVPFSPTFEKRANSDPIINPSFLWNFYNIINNGTNSTNSQGIAAFADYYSGGALQSFWAQFSVPTAQITVEGQDCLAAGCDETESDLDMQYLTAIGQGISTYFINQAESSQWILDWAQQVDSLKNPPLVNSISYGLDEAYQCQQISACETFGYNAQQYIQRTDTELAKLGTRGVTIMVSSGDSGAAGQSFFSTGNCPIDDSKYCPLGGCTYTTTSCGALTFTDVSTSETCFYPMGNQNTACYDILSDESFDDAYAAFVNGQTDCDIEIDDDSQGNDQIYSTCACSKIKEVTSGNFKISGYTYNQHAGAVFSVEYPATSPYITSVGATMLKASNPDTEVAASIDDGAVITSGGGFSVYTPMPSFQKSAVAAYLSGGTSLPPSYSFNSQNRAIPDIALLGHNFEIATSSNTNKDQCPCRLEGVDGTSCSSPAFAGFVSLINNALLNSGLGPVGPLNQILYQMAIDQPDAFNTISVGNNKCTNSFCCLYGYENSERGWNPVTGLGTPDFTKLQDYVIHTKLNPSDDSAATSTTASVALLSLILVVVLICESIN